MISALNVVHKKVQGRLIVVTKPANEVENMGLVSPPDTPFLAFLAASDPVYIPFKTISKLQSSVQGSKVTLFKFDILPAFTSSSSSVPPMPANFIFNFVGPNAETNRETVKKALPNFPYVEPPPEGPSASSLPPSPEKAPAMQIDSAILMPTSSPTTKSITSPFKSPLSNQLSQDALERAILASPSSQSTKKQRERRVERLRKAERLRIAYHDLVISPPHIYSDEEFWLTYAWDSNDQDDGAEADDLISRKTSSGSNGTPPKPVSDAAKEAVAQFMDREQTRSIENELEAGSGFLDLLMKNFVDGRLKLVLTPALRKQIYEEYPMVRVAYDARVPNLMTPAAFWDNFFKAQLGKLMRKKLENETEKTKKRTKSKSAKSTSAKASAAAASASKPEMTKEERETLFFEKLTEATPAQLDALVWQSRASDTLSHDPSKSSHSTSRKSLLSYFAEDDATKPTETKNFGTAAPSVYDASPELVIPKSAKTEHFMDLTKETVPYDPIAQQKALLKQRIAQLSRSSMSSTASATNGTQFTSYRSEPSQRSAETGTITSEEMLFSALQEQTTLENSSKKTKKSAGAQSVMTAWYGGTENGVNGDPLSEKPSDAVELLDGIIVEAGELDDSSWTELKREREKRNRHLQLIRKFNRHGHIVVSSASHASEVEESGEGAHEEENTSEVTTSGRSLRVKSSPTKVKRETPIPFSQAVSTSSMDLDESISQNDLKPVPFPPLSSESTRPPYPMEDPPHTKSWTLNIATRVRASAPVVPPSHAFDKVQSELEKWISTTYAAPARLKADRSLFTAGKRETGNTMEIDLGEFNGLIFKIDQWKRHFWNIIERFTSATEGTAEAQRTQAAGIEKLAPVVAKLQEFMDLISDMASFLTSSAKGYERARETHEMTTKLQRQKEAVQRCLVIYSNLNTGETTNI